MNKKMLIWIFVMFLLAGTIKGGEIPSPFTSGKEITCYDYNDCITLYKTKDPNFMWPPTDQTKNYYFLCENAGTRESKCYIKIEDKNSPTNILNEPSSFCNLQTGRIIGCPCITDSQCAPNFAGDGYCEQNICTPRKTVELPPIIADECDLSDPSCKECIKDDDCHWLHNPAYFCDVSDYRCKECSNTKPCPNPSYQECLKERCFLKNLDLFTTDFGNTEWMNSPSAGKVRIKDPSTYFGSQISTSDYYFSWEYTPLTNQITRYIDYYFNLKVDCEGKTYANIYRKWIYTGYGYGNQDDSRDLSLPNSKLVSLPTGVNTKCKITVNVIGEKIDGKSELIDYDSVESDLYIQQQAQVGTGPTEDTTPPSGEIETTKIPTGAVEEKLTADNAGETSFEGCQMQDMFGNNNLDESLNGVWNMRIPQVCFDTNGEHLFAKCNEENGLCEQLYVVNYCSNTNRGDLLSYYGLPSDTEIAGEVA